MKQLNKYLVHWQTQTGGGAAFYKGKEYAFGKDSEDAKFNAKRNVIRRAFSEFSINHIIVTKIEEQ